MKAIAVRAKAEGKKAFFMQAVPGDPDNYDEEDEDEDDDDEDEPARAPTLGLGNLSESRRQV